MTRRDWVMTLGTGLCVGLVPACAPTRTQTLDDKIAAAGVPWAKLQDSSGTRAGSPYTPTAAPIPTSRPTDLHFEQASYPAKPAGEELLPVPPALSDAVARRPPPAATQPPLPPLTEVKAKPLPDPALVSALRCYLDKRPAEALQWLNHYDRQSQDILLHLLPVVARFAEVSPNKIDQHEMATLVDQLSGVTAALRPKADLIIDKICFVENIWKFGDYDKLEEDHVFRPGEEVRVYVELKNFSSVPHGDGYRISLAGRGEIREFRGGLFSNIPFKDRTQADVSLSPRNDCFSRYNFWIPPNIPPGRYTLWLYVTEVSTRRTASKSLDFQVGPARD
jgi:hypothetical protein